MSHAVSPGRPGQGPPGSTHVAVRLGGGDGVVVSTRLRVLPVAGVLIALHVALSWWRLSRSWFWQDDFHLMSLAATEPFPGVLFTDYNGHLVPGTFLVAWLIDTVSPLSWLIGAGAVLLVLVATDVAMLAALYRWFGDRPAILVPFAMFCATSLTLTATVWWAAALQWLPTALALALALWFHAGYVRNRDPRDAIGAVASVAFGLFFFEKAIVIPVVLALVTTLYNVPGPLPVRPWRAFRRFVPYWIGHAAVAGGYLAFYLSSVQIDDGGGAEGEGVGELITNMVWKTFVPGLLGGPIDWMTTPENSLGSWSGPPAWLSWLTGAIAVVLVVGSTLLVRGAWRAWVILGLFLAFSVALVARARLGFVGPFIGLDHRYLTDAALLGPVCVALALIPLRPGLDRAVPRAFEDDEGGRRRRPVIGGPRRERLMTRWQAWKTAHRPQVLLAGAATVVVVTACGAISGDRFMRSWEENPGPAYFANLQRDLANASPQPVFMFDYDLPPLIMEPNFENDRKLSAVAPVLERQPAFGTSTSRFSVVDGEGHVRPGTVDGPSATPFNAKGLACSSPDAPRTGTAVPMPQPPPEWDWIVAVDYLANQDTAALVGYGEQRAPVPVRLARGLHRIYVKVYGGGPAVTVTDLDRGAVVCVNRVQVGNPAPEPENPPATPGG